MIGHRFYDIERRMWRFRPLYEGVTEMINRGLGYWAVIKLDKLPERYDVHRESIIRVIYPARGTCTSRYPQRTVNTTASLSR
ncbi:hypothetical protein [Vulcanisaeta sp. JCM 16159]|uniref:hypothetical protein n=1 Tax=Vulcanisaeta sp. JCM 16159 TaxID=1295371 RepID=UPI000AFECD65